MSYVDQLYGLSGKVAAVIGGSGVLGGSMVDALANAGASVAILYNRNKEAAEKKVKKIQDSGGKGLAVQADSTHADQLQEALNQIVTAWKQVDILVNAPGVNSATPVFDIKEEEWQRIIDTNLKGVFSACRVFGKHMIDQKIAGSIINISSASSELPLSRVFTYSISKAGVNNMTRFLAREWAPFGIRVNAVLPGFFPAEQNRKILTEERKKSIFAHTPMARFGEPDELSGAVIWLASTKASSFVTGAVIAVDGGFTAMTI